MPLCSQGAGVLYGVAAPEYWCFSDALSYYVVVIMLLLFKMTLVK